MAPQYTPRGHGSSSVMCRIALTFGAPVMLPHGNSASNMSTRVRWSSISPVTVDVSCHTVS